MKATPRSSVGRPPPQNGKLGEAKRLAPIFLIFQLMMHSVAMVFTLPGVDRLSASKRASFAFRAAFVPAVALLIPLCN